MFIHLSALSLFTVSVIRAEYLTTSNADGLTGLDGIDEVLQDLVEYTDYEVPETPANADIVLLETFQERDSDGKYKSAESFEKKFVRSLHGCDSDDGCKYKGSVDR